MKHAIIASICIAILLGACTPAAPAPTPLPPTETPSPATATPLPPTSTPEPVQPEMPGLIPVVDNWEGAPVKPGAIARMFELGDYFSTIGATEAEIRAFYQTAMTDLG